MSLWRYLESSLFENSLKIGNNRTSQQSVPRRITLRAEKKKVSQHCHNVRLTVAQPKKDAKEMQPINFLRVDAKIFETEDSLVAFPNFLRK